MASKVGDEDGGARSGELIPDLNDRGVTSSPPEPVDEDHGPFFAPWHEVRLKPGSVVGQAIENDRGRCPLDIHGYLPNI